MIRSRIITALLAGVMVPATAQAEVSSSTRTVASTQAVPPEASATANVKGSSPLTALIAEALENNPEIQAALQEREAARHRILPAGALDDPLLEAGVINAPLASSPFNREDMTMKMIGLSQRLPFPGRRGLRQDVAAKDAEAVGYGYQETVNRIVRGIKTAYFDLGLTLE
ncbi:MAG: TolC family protein, partial [Nitrosomonadaceae bacterium]